MTDYDDMDADDLTEDGVSDLSDEELNRFVGSWLKEATSTCGYCGGKGKSRPFGCPGSGLTDCSHCGGRGDIAEDYCTDPAAAFRLLERMPNHVSLSREFGAHGDPLVTTCESLGGEAISVSDENRKRALTEAAAILAIRGVEPREEE